MTTADETPGENLPLPTPAVVLGWVAAAGDRAWFPAAHAAQANVPREGLDEPIALLRHAGLIRVQDWVKGLGQGYAVTPDGLTYVHEPQKLAKLLARPQPVREAVPDDPPTTFDRGEEVRQSLLSPRPPLVVQVLIVVNVVWFLVGLALAVREGRSGNAYLAAGDVALLERLGAVSGFDLARGDWWRLVTAAFLHIGALHLLVNMYSLASVGSLAEAVWGRRRFLGLYLAAGVGGSCLAMAVQPAAILAGASGAIWGLMTSLVAWLLFHRQHLPPTMVNDSLRRLGTVIAVNAVISFIPGISWAGHFGGGIVGFLVACLFAAAQRVGRAGRWAALTAAGLLMAACVGGLMLYSERSERWLTVRLFAHLQQQAEYAKTLDAALQPIGRPEVEKVYRGVMTAVRVDPTRDPNLSAKVAKLRADAEAFADVVATRPPPAVTTLPDRYRDYAAAVRELADAMLAVLRQPDAGVAELKERKKAVDARWTAVGALGRIGM